LKNVKAARHHVGGVKGKWVLRGRWLRTASGRQTEGQRGTTR
jgi:hypothetical protein